MSGPSKKRLRVDWELLAKDARGMSLDRLPPEVLAIILTKLDVPSICAITLTCRSFRTCAQDNLKFLRNFHLLEIAAPIDPLRRLLLPNASLRSLKLDCRKLNESSIDHILQPGLLELSLRNCYKFSGKLFSAIGARCKDLRSLYVSSIADNGEFELHDGSDLEELLEGCTQLEELVLMFDATLFPDPDFTCALRLASDKLTYLQIGYIPEEMVIELLSPTVPPNQSPNHIPPHVFPNIHKLCLTVDRISNTMINTISNTLVHINHLDLRDHPILATGRDYDLTDEGLQLINQHGRLKHLSLIRSQEYNPTLFRYVTDEGILFMGSANMESISLAGFCNVTDTGFKTLLHACPNLYELKIANGYRMTDLVFQDMHATSLALTYVSLRNCELLTNSAVFQLALNKDLIVLDFRDTENIGDEALQVISKLQKLKTLLLDKTDVTDLGLSYLQKGAKSSLVKLSISGCRRLTSKCVSSIFNGGSNRELKELDLSSLCELTNGAVLYLAKNRIPLVDLRMGWCPGIGDMSVMALASMTMADGDGRRGGSLRTLDLYNCGGITKLAFQWLRKPYFPGLRWLGVSASKNRELVELLMLDRPSLNLMTRGENLGTDRWDDFDDIILYDYDDVDDPDRVWEDDSGSDDEVDNDNDGNDDGVDAKDDVEVDNDDDDGNDGDDNDDNCNVGKDDGGVDNDDDGGKDDVEVDNDGKDDVKADNDDDDGNHGKVDDGNHGKVDDDDDDDDDDGDDDDDKVDNVDHCRDGKVGVNDVVGWEKCLLIRMKRLGLSYIVYR